MVIFWTGLKLYLLSNVIKDQVFLPHIYSTNPSVCPPCCSYNGLCGWGNPQGNYWQWLASVFDVISLVTQFPQQGLSALKIHGKLKKEYIIHASLPNTTLMCLHQTTSPCGTNQYLSISNQIPPFEWWNPILVNTLTNWASWELH